MTDLLTKWLAHYDPIHRGYTPRGIANGVCATNGFAFPRIAGGYNLYRGDVALGGIDYTVPVGAASASASTSAQSIDTFSWRPANASTTYAFAIRAVGGGGVESAAEQTVEVFFDGGGVPDALKPNAPTSLAIARGAGGCFELRWHYREENQEDVPITFEIYSDNGTGTVEYNAPIGSTPYVPRRLSFAFVTGPFAHGAARIFGVRAVTANGAHDGNSDTVSARAVAVSPPAPTDVLAELVEEE